MGRPPLRPEEILCPSCGARVGEPCRRIGGQAKHACPRREREAAERSRRRRQEDLKRDHWERP